MENLGSSLVCQAALLVVVFALASAILLNTVRVLLKETGMKEKVK